MPRWTPLGFLSNHEHCTLLLPQPDFTFWYIQVLKKFPMAGQPLHWLYPLQIGTKGQRFYYWQLAVSKWKTDEPLLVRWPSCQHVATRRSRVVACSHWGGSRSPLDLLQPPGAIRSLHVLLKVDGGPIKIENPLILTTVKMVKSSQFLLRPGEEARQREQRQCAGFFGLLLPYLPFDSLFPRQPTNRWLQFLLPAAESHTREPHAVLNFCLCHTSFTSLAMIGT